ncbi:MAG: 30S ribosomal protein S10 [Candidatus Altiarchaeum hamiconexum]|uniref:Small ribosomal subunit protein uS10 n=1 Tax=Candidatus Altarchaeum hamiconexum TaxID=1803513 RepID=A0A8J7YVA6_9ARCH|nr:30S ribosomal protein S10 [Candidatus Altarchaeum hamiconexum]OIQ04939.1 MAG: 30S ribosomal protein S10 [Candidatus Altarchaeum sp. CG2_30_32_3053]PIN67103.1 MAG: 30S ribosomal protein S10 [Candidatus Altarchaeum sp. CG12_big_fil_rev_8_21_14_0_65_33_22]PIV27061.1 MAG: 30S ribosomal protein S10 [Candidatus Altarchaeum sp. CG03_land_8_20_14_0_80_32_618]PIX48703.1 MAG: 30S ribosomal protein S10 [Candidatus Altarchaeum sp. CG_4_8_14_3_um_filter_33_2054]PIZ31861.1 MAG: 30S ribosomal protein S10 
MERARILIYGSAKRNVENITNQIVSIAKNNRAVVRGPIPLPTKKIRVVVRKNVSGEGNTAWDRWEMRISKRIVDIYRNDKAMRDVMKIPMPDDVHVEIDVSR